MSTFVLVHGAWHGGWCWQRVVPFLTGRGHAVHAPTLSGVSDRAHLASPLIGLDTHIEDVVAMIRAYDLTDVVLVGHSYGGQVISGVADRIPERIALRIHLDGFIGDGRPAVELQPSEIAHHYRESVEDAGFGWLIPTRSLAKLGVTDPEDQRWLTERLTPHPWRTFTDPLVLSGAQDEVPAAFVESVDWMRVFRPFAELAREKGWPVEEIATGHESMVTAPEDLADVLDQLAS